MVPVNAFTEVVAMAVNPTSNDLKPGFLEIKRSSSSTSLLIDCHGEQDTKEEWLKYVIAELFENGCKEVSTIRRGALEKR